jgi:hypothetical protein
LCIFLLVYIDQIFYYTIYLILHNEEEFIYGHQKADRQAIVDAGIITDKTLELALKILKESGKRFGALLERWVSLIDDSPLWLHR